MSVGVGLMTVMAGGAGSGDVVIEVQPTPVVVQPAAVEIITPGAATPVAQEPRVVQAATPAPAPAPTPEPVTQTESS